MIGSFLAKNRKGVGKVIKPSPIEGHGSCKANNLNILQRLQTFPMWRSGIKKCTFEAGHGQNGSRGVGTQGSGIALLSVRSVAQ